MNSGTSTQGTGEKKPMPRGRLVAILVACGVVVAGGITAISLNAAAASAKAEAAVQENIRLCQPIIDDGADTARDARLSASAAGKALEAVKSTKLPGGAGTSTAYSKRPAAKATTATKTTKAQPAHDSGATLTGNVTEARDTLKAATIPTDCSDRSSAEAIRAATASAKSAIKTLDSAVGTLQGDFMVFQAEEAKRIAGVKADANRVAAEKEAAARRKAADQKQAAQKAAAQKAAGQKAAAVRQSAEKAAAARRASTPDKTAAPRQAAPAQHRAVPREKATTQASRKATKSYVAARKAAKPYVAPKQASKPYVAPRMITTQPVRPATPRPGKSGSSGRHGGGVVNPKNDKGVCWTSNGMGGTKPCGS